jgi:Xaa-Pro aminopeptidase
MPLLLLASLLGVASLGSSSAQSTSLPGQQPLSEYSSRRQVLMQKYKDGVTVLLGAHSEDYEDAARFRQTNNFMYFTGVEVPGAYLILIPEGLIQGAPAREILFLPPRNPYEEAWTGEQIGPGPEAIQAFGIQDVESSDKFYSRLFDILSSPPYKVERPDGPSPPKLHIIAPRVTTTQQVRERRFVDAIVNIAPHVTMSNIASVENEMRKVKSPPEVDLIRKAVDITAQGLRAASVAIRPGIHEYEVQAEVESTFVKLGSERTGFASIIGSGRDSTIVHYNQNRNIIQPGDVVVVDVGAEYCYYNGDLTRTFPATGRFTPRQREIYQLVLDAQRSAEKVLKPGETTMKQLEQSVIAFMKASPTRDIHGNTIEKYFIHGIGHWLGMETHDPGDYSKPIPVGAVLTIEPGIYLPDEKIGVRIEDNYLVTGSGLVKLSRDLPSEPDEIEDLMATGRPGSSKKTGPSTGGGRSH